MRQVQLHIEGVPNPNAIKFVLENGVLSQDSYEFTQFADTGYSPLARKLFMFKYIESVLVFKNYITLRKKADSDIEWEEVLLELKGIVQGHLAANEPILYLGMAKNEHNIPKDEVLGEMIQQVLDGFVRPAAQQDGGDIFFDSYENGVLKLGLKGSCKGCPYINQTVQQGVEPALRQYVPEVKQVVW